MGDIRPYSWLTQSDHETWITCPHCGYVDEETCEYPRELREDGDVAEFVCGHCDRDFDVQIHVSCAFESMIPMHGPRHIPWLSGRAYIGQGGFVDPAVRHD